MYGSPFPSLNSKVRYMTTLERAGFDVNYSKNDNSDRSSRLPSSTPLRTARSTPSLRPRAEVTPTLHIQQPLPQITTSSPPVSVAGRSRVPESAPTTPTVSPHGFAKFNQTAPLDSATPSKVMGGAKQSQSTYYLSPQLSGFAPLFHEDKSWRPQEKSTSNATSFFNFEANDTGDAENVAEDLKAVDMTAAFSYGNDRGGEHEMQSPARTFLPLQKNVEEPVDDASFLNDEEITRIETPLSTDCVAADICVGPNMKVLSGISDARGDFSADEPDLIPEIKWVQENDGADAVVDGLHLHPNESLEQLVKDGGREVSAARMASGDAVAQDEEIQVPNKRLEQLIAHLDDSLPSDSGSEQLRHAGNRWERSSHYLSALPEQAGPGLVHPRGEGPCRGCHMPVEGKRVTASELSGQWHRRCFHCAECDLQFDKHHACYVIADTPYCQEHYHERNGSICKLCGGFIEGDCLENDRAERFHPGCLVCVVCHEQISSDYLLINGDVPLCGAHDLDQLAADGLFEFDHGPSDAHSTHTVEKRRTRLIAG
ncbi:LIM domain-containing protein KNAG_0L02040 [Huiozyma naganishii CBS 8797]|uniref:LIM zinc-binding domain-containing protein n=1 Tax=Huiozyma naganishii (strain ATCC MYA-139 / BCRC 22969 / CBS 8797 / KCTC 17520 / NBRC 10181 / NCYC 3082 / Yp74L-3) TaxID=1071383 RepID=J7S3U2_HUIN7|nr:hypothetical protein KNAG_0L02040 [Kazachstania naganishii CBS 8797]CCK72822.1 hypothetical protein KNAG_0L02040 [Kazachstania naganishii CBS 8797]